MVIFAWILWVLFILKITFVIAVVTGTCIAISGGKNVQLRVSGGILIDIAVFVFLTLYLF